MQDVLNVVTAIVAVIHIAVIFKLVVKVTVIVILS